MSEGMSKEEFFEALMGGMPQEVREALRKAVYAKSDAMVSNMKTRKMERDRIEAMGDPNLLKGFDSACNMYDLNVQVVQLLGNLKAMLDGFDANDLSSANLKSNLDLVKRLHMLIAISMENISDGVKALAEGNNNETGDGNSSG